MDSTFLLAEDGIPNGPGSLGPVEEDVDDVLAGLGLSVPVRDGSPMVTMLQMVSRVVSNGKRYSVL